ncbi:MAG: HDIG domain-containing protein [Clostridiales bacterium]|nr:HDIG domain-containing protein [Clostridiales bacterium]
MNKLSRVKKKNGIKTKLDNTAPAVSRKLKRNVIMGLGTFLVLLSFIVSISPKRYDLSVGMVPGYTIFATRDLEDEISTQSNRELAAAAVTPMYKFADGITEQVLIAADNVFTQLSGVRQYAENLPDYNSSRQYTQDELSYAASMLTLINLRDYQLVTLMNATPAQYDELITALRSSIKNTMQGHVSQGQENIAINSIMQIVGYKTNVGLLQNVVLPTLNAVIAPNMVIDQEQTQAAREAAMKAVDPVIYKQGQSIVVRGEGRVKANQIAMLRELGLLDDKNIDFKLYGGSLLVAISAFAVMMVLMYLVHPQLFDDHRLLSIIFIMLLFVILLSNLAKSIQMIYITPVIVAAMLLSITIGTMPAVIINAFSSLISSLILLSATNTTNSDFVTIFVCSLVSGTAAAIVLRGTKRQRSPILLAGSVAVLINLFIVLGFGLINNSSSTTYLERSLYAGGAAAIATILCIAVQSVLESLFNLPTYNRLMELSNPNHPLLRRLLLEAPGTYHHCILIANMAEASAEAIGANALLARVGGYYHDIGKLKRPHYFKENQIGTGNLHDQTDPAVSAAIITSHVRDGMTLGKQYRLPKELLQIVEQHHGNSLVAYFYSKAGEPDDDSSFRYDGIPPQSAEAAIVMLCDTIEAAVRTLSSPTPEEIKAFIWKLIKSKLDSDLLSNAPLSFKDLYTIRDTCAQVIHGIFHERIDYPDKEKHSPLSRVLSSLSAPKPSPALVKPTEGEKH